MILEQEIKLQVVNDNVIDLVAIDWLKPFWQSELVCQQLVSTYYDTPELYLINHGVGLRLRKVEDQWLQTVKCTGKVQDGLHQREEWEHTLSSEKFDLTQLKQTPLVDMIDDVEIWPKLQPIFTTDFGRQIIQLELDDKTQVELAYDRGEVRTETSAESIHEIELELKRGSVASLKQLAEQFCKHLELSPSDTSKAKSGYMLVSSTKVQ